VSCWKEKKQKLLKTTARGGKMGQVGGNKSNNVQVRARQKLCKT